jgi:hypothetical protein
VLGGGTVGERDESDGLGMWVVLGSEDDVTLEGLKTSPREEKEKELPVLGDVDCDSPTRNGVMVNLFAGKASSVSEACLREDVLRLVHLRITLQTWYRNIIPSKLTTAIHMPIMMCNLTSSEAGVGQMLSGIGPREAEEPNPISSVVEEPIMLDVNGSMAGSRRKLLLVARIWSTFVWFTSLNRYRPLDAAELKSVSLPMERMNNAHGLMSIFVLGIITFLAWMSKFISFWFMTSGKS